MTKNFVLERLNQKLPFLIGLLEFSHVYNIKCPITSAAFMNVLQLFSL